MLDSKALQVIEDRAWALGRDAGRSAGTWFFNPGTEDEARGVLRGIEDGDPEVMDSEPAPLSGEWAGDPTPDSVLAEVTGSAAWDSVLTDDEAPSMLDAYEAGFSEGFWQEVERSARALLGN